MFLGAASSVNAISYVHRVANGVGGRKGTSGSIIYVSSVKWIWILSLGIVRRSDVASTVLYAQMCSAYLFRITKDIVIYAEIVSRTFQELLPIFSRQQKTIVGQNQSLILELQTPILEHRRPALFEYPGRQVLVHRGVPEVVCYIRRDATVSDT